MRVRDQVFALEMVNNLEEHGNLEEAKVRAAKYAYMARGGELSTESALRKANVKLGRPDVKAAIAEFIEDATFDPKAGSGFSKVEGIKWLVKHIRGEVTEQKLDREGGVVELRRAASLPALTKYLDLTIPEEPKHLRVQSESVSVNTTIVRQEEGGVPSMVARPIGEQTTDVFNELSEECESNGDRSDLSALPE